MIKRKLLSDAALAERTGVPVLYRIHADPSTGAVIALDAEGVVRWFDGAQLRTDFVATTTRRASFHYPDAALYAVADVRAFVAGVGEVSERAMQWTAGTSGSLYREAIRYRDRVLVVWGRNNARNLQSIAITTTEPDARALVAAFRAHPPKGFVSTSSHHLERRGGIAREYAPIASPPGARPVMSATAHCVDEVVEWTTHYPKYERDERREVCASEAEAIRLFDRLELAWFERGGAPAEVEWMASIQQRRDTTIFGWLEWRVRDQADPVGFVRALLADAGLEVTALPTDPAALVDHLARAVPAVHWLRVGERVGAVEAKATKPGVMVYLDRDHFAVTTIKTPRSGRPTARVNREASLTRAQARWDAAVAG